MMAWIKSLLSPVLVVLPWLNLMVCFTIYLFLGKVNSCLSQRSYSEMKYNQPCPRFELMLAIQFSWDDNRSLKHTSGSLRHSPSWWLLTTRFDPHNRFLPQLGIETLIFPYDKRRVLDTCHGTTEELPPQFAYWHIKRLCPCFDTKNLINLFNDCRQLIIFKELRRMFVQNY